MNPRHRRSPKNLQINDVFPEWYDSGGIFSAMTGGPWEPAVSPKYLDILYHGSHSGNKFCAPIVYRFLKSDGTLDSTGLSDIATAIETKFGAKWAHIWGLYSTQYSPLANYHMEETRERDATRDTDTTTVRIPDLTETTEVDDSSTTELDSTDETTHGHVVTTGIQRAESGQTNKFGFNSSEAVPVSTETGTVTETDTETNSGKDTTVVDSSESVIRDATDVKTTTGTDTIEEDSGVVDHEEETVTKEGNLFKAPYEMLQGDRAFWMDDYFSIVFADVDSVLCLSIYPEREINIKVY